MLRAVRAEAPRTCRERHRDCVGKAAGARRGDAAGRARRQAGILLDLVPRVQGLSGVSAGPRVFSVRPGFCGQLREDFASFCRGFRRVPRGVAWCAAVGDPRGAPLSVGNPSCEQSPGDGYRWRGRGGANLHGRRRGGGLPEVQLPLVSAYPKHAAHKIHPDEVENKKVFPFPRASHFAQRQRPPRSEGQPNRLHAGTDAPEPRQHRHWLQRCGLLRRAPGQIQFLLSSSGARLPV
mmetsp:Transcript_29769/g.81615  ORF Transcript_29769/g.81615 Transcript_29769/m.81615 type:complete len:236 (-) Transcript_29769:103-810(-)